MVLSCFFSGFCWPSAQNDACSKAVQSMRLLSLQICEMLQYRARAALVEYFTRRFSACGYFAAKRVLYICIAQRDYIENSNYAHYPQPHHHRPSSSSSLDATSDHPSVSAGGGNRGSGGGAGSASDTTPAP